MILGLTGQLIPQRLWPLLVFLDLFVLGFDLSFPVFLQDRQNNRPIDAKHWALTTLQSTKRIVLPCFLVFLFLFVIIVILALALHPSTDQVKSFFNSITTKGWNPILAIVSVLGAFSVFFPMFFSLEKEGILQSFKHSVAVSFKHLPFISMVMIIDFIVYSLGAYLSLHFFRLLVNVFTGYVGFIVSASALYYYQRFIKREVSR